MRPLDGSVRMTAVEYAENLRDAWYEGWYEATNGKWGLPESGTCPYGDMPDE